MCKLQNKWLVKPVKVGTLCWKLNTTHKLKTECLRLWLQGLHFRFGLGSCPSEGSHIVSESKFSPDSSGRLLNPAASNSLCYVGGGRGGAGGPWSALPLQYPRHIQLSVRRMKGLKQHIICCSVIAIHTAHKVMAQVYCEIRKMVGAFRPYTLPRL